MSARRPRTSNRRYTKAKEEQVTDREEPVGDKTKQKKRKLSDLLGPPWSEDDLKRFYQSYRRHGRDWKKVAAMFHDRTMQMVEMLYNMNKAYLSLPEGAASVAGLIAMMTDHYNILEQSRSLDDESSKEAAMSVPCHDAPFRLRIASRAPHQGNKSGLMMPHASGLSGYGGPSPAKKPRTIPGNRPRAVGKRTPRIPSTHLHGKTKSGKFPVVESMEDPELGAFGDCDEFRVAMTLAASASQRATSPQISCTPVCGVDRSRNFPVENGHFKLNTTGAGSGSSATRHTGSNMADGASEESRDTRNGKKATTSMGEDCGERLSPNDEAKSKPQTDWKLQTKRGKCHTFSFDELKEECSCTEEGFLKYEDANGVDGGEQSSKKKRLASQKTKRRNRQLFSGDERSGLDALATLADLSLNGLLPSPKYAEEPPMKSFKPSKDNTAEKVSWTREDCVEPRFGSAKESMRPMAKGLPVGGSKEPHSQLDFGSNFDSNSQKGVSAADLRKRRRKGPPKQAPNLHSEDFIGRNKAKRTAREGQAVIKLLGWPVKQEHEAVEDVVVGESEVEHVGMAISPLKERNVRKLKRMVLSTTQTIRNHCPHASELEERFSNKVRLIHCLSSEKVRRWCLYEWFYSAIDLPWFARNEFVEYLNHAGLGHVPRLTRAEWGVIRGSLGKPRRLSKRFLEEEREKLDEYRDLVRKHYQEVRIGQRDGLPTDLPRPLTVSQRVIAWHPRSKEVYNGNILTVDLNKCRVQFDRPEMGVELISDIDCMPVNSFENLSDAVVRKNIIVDGGSRGMEDSKHGVKSWVATNARTAAAQASINPRLEKRGSVPLSSSSSSCLLSTLCKNAEAADTVDSVLQVKAAANEATAAAHQAMFNQPCSLAQVQAKEADIRALADLTRALDKKEAILLELRNMNNDADANGDVVRKSEMFQKQYATLLLQLKEVNQQVCGALLHLRQRNKYQENLVPPWQRSALQTISGYVPAGNLESNSLEQFPLAKEVTLHAEQQARLMVNTAVETMLSTKEGEDALTKISIALNQLPKANICMPQGDGGVQVDVGTMGVGQGTFGLDRANGDDVSGASKLSGGQDTVFLSDLMSTCIAALLMVQAFTERHFPPAEIAMAFDSILANLRPCSSQNYQIHSEIQHYANLLKNQIIALIPTESLPLDCPPLPH